jgi:hypothetical protein
MKQMKIFVKRFLLSDRTFTFYVDLPVSRKHDKHELNNEAGLNDIKLQHDFNAVQYP